MHSYVSRGPFVIRELTHGFWQVTTPAPADIYLRSAAAAAVELLTDAGVHTIALSWNGDRVTVSVATARGVNRFDARSAVVHEARQRLYESLPLARFDVRAQRFWKRIFALMRVPGGRFLLKFAARGR